MPPVNNTILTAIEITGFPYNIVQTDIHDAGTTYTVYYKFTAPVDSRLVGVWGFGGSVGSAYQPHIAFAEYATPGFPTVIGNPNTPIQFGIVPGVEYLITVATNVGNPTPAILTLSVLLGAENGISEGDILINDDSDSFPLIVLSGTEDYTVKYSVTPFVAGEAGDILENGISAWEDTAIDDLVTYDANFTEIARINLTAGTIPFIRACNQTKFYVGFDNPGVAVVTVRDLLDTGAFGAVLLTLTPFTGIRGIAANNAETILYWGTNLAGSALKQWDIPGDVALADLVVGVGTDYIVDILVLQDDSILVGYDDPASANHTVRRYDAAGTLLNTYNYSTSHPANTFARLAYALDDPVSFWLMTHPVATPGETAFLNIRCSDGTVLTTRVSAEYEIGVYEAAETETPLARFGNSYSCPFMIARAANDITPPDPPDEDETGIYFIDPTSPESGGGGGIPTLRHDVYRDEERKIPNPTVKTALLGE